MRKIFVVIAVLVMLSTACGSSSSKTTAAGHTPVALDGKVNDGKLGEVKNGAIEIEQDNYYFNPAYTKAAAGSTFKVELKNEGDAPHTFTIDALNIDQQVEPGKTAEVTVTMPADGAVEYYCKFHVGQGMHGAFYAKAGDTMTGATPTGGAVTSTTERDGY